MGVWLRGCEDPVGGVWAHNSICTRPPHLTLPPPSPPQEDFTFSTISGATTELLLDLPDGEWSIVVKNDIFDKTSGSVHNYDMVRGDGPGGGLQPVWIWPRTWARGIADARGIPLLPLWSAGFPHGHRVCMTRSHTMRARAVASCFCRMNWPQP